MTHRPAFPGDDCESVVAVQAGDRAEAVRLWARAAVERYLAAEQLVQVTTPWGARLSEESARPLPLDSMLAAHNVIAARFRRDTYQPNRDLFASKSTTAEEIADQWWSFLHREVAELVASTALTRLVVAAIAEPDRGARDQAGTALAGALRALYGLPAPDSRP